MTEPIDDIVQVKVEPLDNNVEFADYVFNDIGSMTSMSNCELKPEAPVVVNSESAECTDRVDDFIPVATAATNETICKAEIVEDFVIYELEPTTELSEDPAVLVKPRGSMTISTKRARLWSPAVVNEMLRKRSLNGDDAKPTTSTAKTQRVDAVSTRKRTGSLSSLSSTSSSAKVLANAEAISERPCFCDLANSENLKNSDRGNTDKLKEFFYEMYNETCQLAPAQQRIVQMALLEAVCKAEDDIEANHWCDQCCL